MTPIIDEILYIGDPLCSWCWGAAPALNQLKAHYETTIPFKILLGGLRPGNTKLMDEKLKIFLKEHWEEIQILTGQPFGFQILEREDFVYDTEPPARAVFTVRQLNPTVEFDFFKAVQHQFYVKGKDTNLLNTYLELCEDFFIESVDFKKLFESPETKQATAEEFEKARMLGVTGFPTVLVKMGQKYKAVARGYDTFEHIHERVEQWLNHS